MQDLTKVTSQIEEIPRFFQTYFKKIIQYYSIFNVLSIQ